MSKERLCDGITYGALVVLLMVWVCAGLVVSPNYQMLGIGTIILALIALMGYLGKLSFKGKGVKG